MDFLRLLRLGYHSNSKQQNCNKNLMAPQPSSLRTSFRALSITGAEIKKSVIYTAEGANICVKGKRPNLD